MAEQYNRTKTTLVGPELWTQSRILPRLPRTIPPNLAWVRQSRSASAKARAHETVNMRVHRRRHARCTNRPRARAPASMSTNSMASSLHRPLVSNAMTTKRHRLPATFFLQKNDMRTQAVLNDRVTARHASRQRHLETPRPPLPQRESLSAPPRVTWRTPSRRKWRPCGTIVSAKPEMLTEPV